jgi:nitroreductase
MNPDPMNPDPMNQVIDLISRHRSVRKFTDSPIADDLLHTIVRAA